LLLGAGLWPGEGQVALCNGLGAASAAYGLAIYYGRDRRMERRVQAFHVAVAAGFFLAGGGNRARPHRNPPRDLWRECHSRVLRHPSDRHARGMLFVVCVVNRAPAPCGD